MAKKAKYPLKTASGAQACGVLGAAYPESEARQNHE
jgi:hypothetical protein